MATGACVEVIGRILGKLKVPYAFNFYPFTRSWMLLEKGKADAVPSVSHKPERESALYFTPEQKQFDATGVFPPDYLWETEYVFFVNRRVASSFRFESYAQIKADGYRIGVNTRYTYDPAFLAAGLNTMNFADPADCLRALAEGRIDLYPLDRTIGRVLLRRLSLDDRITYLPKPLFRKPYLMCFARHSDYPGLQTIMADFNGELRKMRAAGEVDRIFAAYAPDAAAPATHHPLVFVCEPWPPFEYEKDGKAVGINPMVIQRVMERLGLPYEIRFFPWARAWLMAQKGAADVVMSVSYNAEREPYLYYTEEQRDFAKTGKLPPDYLWMTEYVFFVVKKNANRFHFESYAQIKADGIRVGVNRGYTYHPEFLEAKLGSREFSSAREGLEALIAGEIDLYPMDRTIGFAQLREMGLHDSVTTLPKPLFSKPYLAPFVRKSDYPQLRQVMQDFNAELRRLRESGEYQRIRESCLDADQTPR